MRTDKRQFSYTANRGKMRRTTVSFKDPSSENVVNSFGVVQKGGIFKAADNEILYTTTDGNKLDLGTVTADMFGAELVSHEYVNSVGVMTFKSDVTKIAENVFQNKTTLKTISISNKVNSIGKNHLKIAPDSLPCKFQKR